MDLAIIPECYIDTILVETLVPPQSRYNHQKGCGTVTKIMQENFTDRFALGIIDKDKKELDYLQQFDLVIAKGSLELSKHHHRAHYIIRLYPAIEMFILNNLAATGLSPGSFGLPDSLNQFKKLSKRINSKNDFRFIKLFKFLSRQPVADIASLKAWISYLKENPYTASIDFFGQN